jgi:very-short-patch-repair endonuclease
MLAVLVRALRLPEPVRQYQFHPERKWRVDFAWPERGVLVECEGGIWGRGGMAHSHPLGILRDIEKYNAAALAGFRVFRVTEMMLKNGEAARLLQTIFAVV